MLGGRSNPGRTSIEFWSPSGGNCVLPDYPRNMEYYPTMNFISGQLVACYQKSCEMYREGNWEHLVDLNPGRADHSSIQQNDRILLVGGYGTRDSVWVPLDGSPTEPGPIIRHGEYHCTIQVSNDIFIVTGGHQTEERVTEYNLSAGIELQLNNIAPRSNHACGAYQDANGQKVRPLIQTQRCS